MIYERLDRILVEPFLLLRPVLTTLFELFPESFATLLGIFSALDILLLLIKLFPENFATLVGVFI